MANTVVRMPQLGEAVAEGTIGRWLKQPGEHVDRDEPLVEIQTDKVNAEVPSPVAGILQEILLPEGATAAVQSELAIIGDTPPAPGSLPHPAATGRSESATRSPAGEAPPPSESTPSSSGELDPSQSPPASLWAANQAPPRPGQGEGAGGSGSTPGPTTSEPRRFYTPVVRRMAEAHGLDLASLAGTGAHGRVTRRDVEDAIASGTARLVAPDEAAAAPATATAAPATAAPASAATNPPAPPPPGPASAPPSGSALSQSAVPLSPMRRAIAAHLSRARAEIPDAWSMVEIDVTRLDAHRASLQPTWQAREGYELTYLPFFVKAVVAGLRAVPELNATLVGDSLILHRQYDLGIAVSVPGGLVVPVLRHADDLSVAGLARALRDLIVRARAGRLQAAELQGATFTVNNPGALGSILTQPIVPLGQAGIVTMEAIVRRPVVVAGDAIAIRSMMNSALSFDHRIVDGAAALLFLRALKAELETVDYPLF